MKNIFYTSVVSFFVFCYAEPTFSLVERNQTTAYQKHFFDKVYQFSNHNRFNTGNINRDKYTNCYMQVGIEVSIAADGHIKHLSVKEPSPIPIINRYFHYIVNQAAPFDPLKKYYGDELNQLTIFKQFRLNIPLHENSSVSEPCG